MPEVSGVVTARSQYGIKIDDSEEWFNWSKPDFRGEPWEADDATKGKRVVAEVDGKYIQTIKVLDGESQSFTEDDHESVPSAAGEWGFEQKDRLMCRESCAKSATAIFAASIQAGIYKTHPDVGAVTSFAAALEKWCLEGL
jgi:hypothetical protein